MLVQFYTSVQKDGIRGSKIWGVVFQRASFSTPYCINSFFNAPVDYTHTKNTHRIQISIEGMYASELTATFEWASFTGACISVRESVLTSTTVSMSYTKFWSDVIHLFRIDTTNGWDSTSEFQKSEKLWLKVILEMGSGFTVWLATKVKSMYPPLSTVYGALKVLFSRVEVTIHHRYSHV